MSQQRVPALSVQGFASLRRLLGSNPPPQMNSGGASTQSQNYPTPVYAVALVQVGGVAGGAGVNCSWTYNVFTLAGQQVGSALAPMHARMAGVPYDKADDAGLPAASLWADGKGMGTACTLNGALVLLTANERPRVRVCEPGA